MSMSMLDIWEHPLYEIWFYSPHTYGYCKVEADGLKNAQAVWDVLAATFEMKSVRPSS